MTKAEALSEIMYNLQFNETADFEVDDESYSITKEGGYWLKGSNIHDVYCENKTILRKAISQLGRKILVL